MPKSHSQEFSSLRRSILGKGFGALAGLVISGKALAADSFAKPSAANQPAADPPLPSIAARHPQHQAQLLDQFAVTQLLGRERLARETHDFDLEATCFHPSGYVDVSWFSGTAAEFVEVGRKASARGLSANSLKATYFDALSPPVVWVKGKRAIADGSCAVHAFSTLEGIEVHVTAYTRLLWRAEKLGNDWLISGLRGIYLRDTIEPVIPNQTLVIDYERLATFRPSYRFLSYLTTAGGGPIRNDRAGSDRPDLVKALRDGEWRWLDGLA